MEPRVVWVHTDIHKHIREMRDGHERMGRQGSGCERRKPYRTHKDAAAKERGDGSHRLPSTATTAAPINVFLLKARPSSHRLSLTLHSPGAVPSERPLPRRDDSSAVVEELLLLGFFHRSRRSPLFFCHDTSSMTCCGTWRWRGGRPARTSRRARARRPRTGRRARL